MKLRRLFLLVLPAALAIGAGVALAQQFRQGRGRAYRGAMPDDRNGVPNWKVDERFKKDVFTFVRVKYSSMGGHGGRRGGFGGYGYGGWEQWQTDFPDSDLNFSFRLQQLTSLKVAPDPIIRELTSPDLCDYPFLYLIEPGRLFFSDEEAAALRRYLLNGGFLMVDDFWGDNQLDNFLQEMKKVFPEDRYSPAELPLEHEIFHCVYRLKEKPQVPSIHSWAGPGSPTWEDEWRHGPGTREVHFRGIEDDKGRLMAIICHNTDLGDGWEREGESEEYFHEFSEKKSYPMGINIVTYAMTH